tara:strand:- start:9269 stop:10009 length:741 start_codon:yes stop_codon:yes gene_type:complete
MPDDYQRPFPELSTIAEAVDFLNELFQRQLERSMERSTPPNESTNGDGRAKNAFWTLLPPEAQRRFFLKLVSKRPFWPRVRTLVGAPPYSFLRPEDEGVLRASGIARGRVNMAKAESTATSYNQFGHGHYEDGVGRLYRVIVKEHPRGNELPWIGLAAGVRVVADVRIRKRSQTNRMAIFNGSHGTISQASLVFPRIGDMLLLKLVSSLREKSNDNTDDDVLRAKVDVGKQKAAGSPIARLVLNVQ